MQLKFWVFIFGCIAGFANYTFSQTKNLSITIVDIQTNEPLPFVKILPNNNEQVYYTDIDGLAQLPKDLESYTFRFFDYQDTTIMTVDLIKSKKVFLQPEAKTFDEIIIRPGENPAHRIIQHVMNNRKVNDPLKNNSFQYRSFAKFMLTGDTDKEFLRDTIRDSSTLRLLNMLDEQYLFLTETVSKRYFSPPNYDKEVVESYKVSGINNPLFATLANQLQSFSFYDNVFSINEKEFVNPIAPGGLRRYLFILEDTVVREKDSTYTISFRPRKGKNFEGMQGYLYVNTSNWAIEKVIAEPFDAIGLRMKIVQEYRFTNNKKWFPYQLSTEFSMDNIQLNQTHYLVGRSNVYIKDVVFDGIEKKGFNPVKVIAEEDANNKLEALDEGRGRVLNEKEARTYDIIDSIAKENNFERFVKAFEIAGTGSIPYKIFNFPVDRIINFNQQEGYRLGLGLETNSRLSKWFSIGGYFAYGFRDQEWKWGGHTKITMNKERDIHLKLSYQEDVFERGGVDYLKDNFSLSDRSLYRQFFINQMDWEKRAAAQVSGLITPNMKITLLGQHRQITAFDDYQFQMGSTGFPFTTNTFDIFETGFIWNWNIREKVMLLGNQRISLGSKYPSIKLRAVKGWDGLLDGDFDYYRLNIAVDQKFSFRAAGNLQLHANAGLTTGDVPITLLQMPFGTNRSWNLSVLHTFETMVAGSFYADRHAALFARYTFLPLKNKTSWTEPLFGIHLGAGIGEMDNPARHENLTFNTHNQGYYEGGIIVDNLIKFGFNGFGIGVFHAFGAYMPTSIEEGLVYKLSIKFNF
ncbi:MAG: hypothetical protein JJT77_04910 [Crocinitomicaceae bacterium]|nr:hypothetical protein [Crocinitomicaceae bacterium]